MRDTDVARAIVEASRDYVARYMTTDEFIERVHILLTTLVDEDDYDEDDWREILKSGRDQ